MVLHLCRNCCADGISLRLLPSCLSVLSSEFARSNPAPDHFRPSYLTEQIYVVLMHFSFRLIFMALAGMEVNIRIVNPKTGGRRVEFSRSLPAAPVLPYTHS